MNQDPLGFGDGPNPFTYAGNDPINFTDPTGLSQAGNPLNNLYGSYDAYAGGYSGGKVAPAPKPINLNPSFLASPTVNYNSAKSPYAYGPTRTTASRSIDYLAPVNTQADYDRKYGIPLSTNNRVPTNFLSTPQAAPRPGLVNTVKIPLGLRASTGPSAAEVTQREYQREIAAKAWDATRASQGPPTRFDGTSINAFEAQTPYEADVSRLRYLQHENDNFRLIFGTPEAREYERLQLATAGPLERFNIAVGAVAGFTGIQQSGPLSGNQGSGQVRTQAAPIRNRGNGGRGGGIEHSQVQQSITDYVGGRQEVRVYEGGNSGRYRIVDNLDALGRYHQVGNMRYRGGKFSPSAQQRGAIEDLRQALGPDATIIYHDKLGKGPTLINPDLQPNWRPTPSQYRNFGTQQ